MTLRLTFPHPQAASNEKPLDEREVGEQICEYSLSVQGENSIQVSEADFAGFSCLEEELLIFRQRLIRFNTFDKAGTHQIGSMQQPEERGKLSLHPLGNRSIESLITDHRQIRAVAELQVLSPTIREVVFQIARCSLETVE